MNNNKGIKYILGSHKIRYFALKDLFIFCVPSCLPFRNTNKVL